MKRMPRRGRRAQRRATDWIPGYFTALQDLSSANPQQYALVDLQDIDDHDGNVTIERIVGDIGIFNLVDSLGVPVYGAHISAGVAVLETDQLFFTKQVAPNNPVDAEDPWLWLDHWTVYGPDPGVATDFTPAASAHGLRFRHVDIHVRRKLTDAHVLVLVVQLAGIPNIGFDAPGSATTQIYFRTLVKLT